MICPAPRLHLDEAYFFSSKLKPMAFLFLLPKTIASPALTKVSSNFNPSLGNAKMQQKSHTHMFTHTNTQKEKKTIIDSTTTPHYKRNIRTVFDEGLKMF